MNQSVWYEQIDTALIQFISNKVKLNGVPVHVFVRKPEEEFTEVTFPCISLYNLTTERHQSYHDFTRTSLSRNSGGELVFIDNPILFQHVYQTDFWARYQTQMNEMTYTWLSEVGRDFAFNAKTVSGVSIQIYAMEELGFRKSDLIRDKDRLFHSIATYKIQADIDTQATALAPEIIDVEESYHGNYSQP